MYRKQPVLNDQTGERSFLASQCCCISLVSGACSWITGFEAVKWSFWCQYMMNGAFPLNLKILKFLGILQL